MTRVLVALVLSLLAAVPPALAADPYREPGVCYTTRNPFQGGPYNGTNNMCPGDTRPWPVVCIPAHTLVIPRVDADGLPLLGPDGQQLVLEVDREEQCMQSGPNGADAATGITVYDPVSGYQAPREVLEPALTQSDTMNVFGLGWAAYSRGVYPANDYDYAHALDMDQLLELTLVAADIERRDYQTTHVFFTAPKLLDGGKRRRELCGVVPNYHRCAVAYEFAHLVEVMLPPRHPAYQGSRMGHEQIRELFEIYRRPPVVAVDDAVCGRPEICGVR